MYERPYPPTDPVSYKNLLSEKERKLRKIRAKAEHKHLRKVFKESVNEEEKPMQQVFDLGRLASPIWQAYRKFYKERSKNNDKVQHISKWENPAAFKMTKADFLNLRITPETIERHIVSENERTVNPEALPGMTGTNQLNSYSLMKEDMAQAKHGTKGPKLTLEQKNMVVMPNILIMIAHNDGDIADMTDAWGGKKKPWLYNRVFFSGTVYRTGQTRAHAILVEMRFSEGPNQNEDSIHIWDSGHGRYHTLVSHMKRWLGAIGYRRGANPNKITEHYHDDDIPRQRDPFNCAQYMILTAHYLFRYQKPDYTGFIPDLNEPRYIDTFGGMYMYGRKVDKVKKDGSIKEKLFTPSLDSVVKNFSDKKVKDYHRMKRWMKKEMKGFK